MKAHPICVSFHWAVSKLTNIRASGLAAEVEPVFGDLHVCVLHGKSELVNQNASKTLKLVEAGGVGILTLTDNA
jgi:hypothetical protein